MGRNRSTVKRQKEEEIVGALEFEGRTSEDPEFMDWLADHRARNGGKIKIGKGITGVRVISRKQRIWRCGRREPTKRRRGRRLSTALAVFSFP